MSNNFPAIPADYALASIEYDVAFPPATQTEPGLVFSGVNTALIGTGALGIGALALFTFDTPGQFGTFDQVAAEAALVTLLDDCCQFLADATGQTVAAIRPSVTVTRRWTWTDPAGNQARYIDTMAY